MAAPTAAPAVFATMSSTLPVRPPKASACVASIAADSSIATTTAIGFDDSPVATAVQPNLTTVRQPSHQQGQQMAEVLLTLLAGGAPEHVTVLDTELVVRDSA